MTYDRLPNRPIANAAILSLFCEGLQGLAELGSQSGLSRLVALRLHCHMLKCNHTTTRRRRNRRPAMTKALRPSATSELMRAVHIARISGWSYGGMTASHRSAT